MEKITVKGEESTRDSQVVRTDKMMICISWKVSSELDEKNKFDGRVVSDLLKWILTARYDKEANNLPCLYEKLTLKNTMNAAEGVVYTSGRDKDGIKVGKRKM